MFRKSLPLSYSVYSPPVKPVPYILSFVTSRTPELPVPTELLYIFLAQHAAIFYLLSQSRHHIFWYITGLKSFVTPNILETITLRPINVLWVVAMASRVKGYSGPHQHQTPGAVRASAADAVHVWS